MQNLHFGTMGWSYNFWVGNFYPKKMSSKDFLSFYASQFNTVEVDNTFYRIPKEQTVTNWKLQTPQNFLFSLKFPQLITHIRKFKNCEYETEIFLKRVDLLGEKLGALLLQFPPNLGVEHLGDLASFLEKIPKNYKIAVEVRNKGWLDQDFYSLLKTNQVALVWTDNPLISQIKEVTANFLYVRWEGDRKKIIGMLGKIEDDKTEDLKVEAEKLKNFSGEMEVFGYFSKYYSGFPPSDIALLQTNLS